MKEQLLNELIKFILGAVGILFTFALAKLGQFLQANKDKAVAEKGASNFNRALEIAKGMYLVLEKEFDGITKAGEQKKAEMDAKLLQLIPELTQTEIDSINQLVWKEFNKNITPIITPVDEIPADGKVEDKPIDTPTPIVPDAQAQVTEVKAQ